jgi:DNA repair protein RecO (recombination protein O)
MRAGPVRDEGIVLRTLPLGDTSRIVSALTTGHGRVKLVAKGARNSGSRLGALLEPGNELELIFYPHRDRELWMLGDAGLRRAALTGGGTLSKLSHLFAALELADRLLPEREAVPEFDALVRAWLDAWHRSGDEPMAALYFVLEIRWLERTGLGLDPGTCAECGGTLLAQERVRFRAAEGTFVCARCGAGSGRWLEGAVVDGLQRLVETDLDASDVPELGAGERREVGRLLHEHMAFHLPDYRLPSSLYWLAPQRSDRGS